MSKKYVKYELLKFTDDFMFCKVLENNPDLCRELLEVILAIKINKVEHISKQKEIKVKSDGKGVRFDVYLEDSDNRVFDIEMQMVKKRDLPKRARYYQGMLDMDMIQKSCRYGELKDSYVIFICTTDPFGLNLPVYHFENICTEEKALLLKDGAEKVFVNSKGIREGISSDMKSFLDFLEGRETSSKLVGQLQKAVENARQQEEWRHEYMTLAEIYEEKFEEGLEEGREEGRAVGLEEGRAVGLEEGRRTVLIELVKTGDISMECAAERANMTVEEFQKLME